MTVAPATPGLDLSLYIPELKSRKKDAALAEMIAPVDRQLRHPSLLLDLLRARERVGTTALGKSVAVPHGRSVTVARPLLVIARSRRGIEWDAPDDLATHLIMLALAPGEWSLEAYHAFVSTVVAVARLQKHRQRLLAAASSDAVATVLREAIA